VFFSFFLLKHDHHSLVLTELVYLYSKNGETTSPEKRKK